MRGNCDSGSPDQIYYSFHLVNNYNNTYEITGRWGHYLEINDIADGSKLSTDSTRDNSEQQYFIVTTYVYTEYYTDYIMVESTKSWSDAETFCTDHFGSHLASIHTQTQNDQIYTICTNNKQSTAWSVFSGCWIGFNDLVQTGNYIWSDSSAIDFINWRDGAPNSIAAHCSFIKVNDVNLQNYQWEDTTCESKSVLYRFICARYPTIYPTNNPSTEPTLEPTTNYPTNPTFIPTIEPSINPTFIPTIEPSINPTFIPTIEPTIEPTHSPSIHPIYLPTFAPTLIPSFSPSQYPSIYPSISPIHECPTVFIEVAGLPITIDKDTFNGLYTLKQTQTMFGRPIWTASNVQYIQYDGAYWVINGKNNQQLFCASSNVYPPMSAIWSHSSVSGRQLYVHIRCIHSFSPTMTPTIMPTIRESIPKQDSLYSSLDTTIWVMILIIIFCIILSIVVIIIICCKNSKSNDDIIKSMSIKNPMCVLLGIGIYEKDSNKQDFEVQDLEVDIDVKKLVNLFQNHFNYHVVPQYHEHTKIDWTKDEIISLLQQNAKQFAHNLKSDNNNKYDGLIVVVSGHGLTHHLITSDYELISKEVIHREFTQYYPISRTVPRIVIYDMCAGDEQRKGIQEKNHSNKTCVDKDSATAYEISDIPQADSNVVWKRNEENPDYKLAKIYSSNTGFQSKMSNVTGSYLIDMFVNKMQNGLMTIDKKYIVDSRPTLEGIFEKIQEELKCKQLAEATFNNNTKFITFIPKHKMNDDDRNRNIIDDEKAESLPTNEIEMTNEIKLNDTENIHINESLPDSNPDIGNDVYGLVPSDSNVRKLDATVISMFKPTTSNKDDDETEEKSMEVEMGDLSPVVSTAL
eukprot:327791_1